MSQRRYELSDEQFALIEPLLPVPTRGPQRADNRITLNGIFWKLCSGAPWRDVPAHFGKRQTVYERFRRYRERGVFDRILAALHLRLAADGNLDFATWMIDGTTVRASRHAAGARKRGIQRARLKHARRSGGAEAD